LTLHGPAVLDQFDCTTVICAGQTARVDEWKNLIVTEITSPRTRGEVERSEGEGASPHA
jgi:hypothetical protein